MDGSSSHSMTRCLTGERWGIYSATGQLQTFRFTKEDAVAWDRGGFFVVHQFVGR